MTTSPDMQPHSSRFPHGPKHVLAEEQLFGNSPVDGEGITNLRRVPHQHAVDFILYQQPLKVVINGVAGTETRLPVDPTHKVTEHDYLAQFVPDPTPESEGFDTDPGAPMVIHGIQIVTHRRLLKPWQLADHANVFIDQHPVLPSEMPDVSTLVSGPPEESAV